MPTLKYQVDRRIRNTAAKQVIAVFTVAFSACMVIGRLLSGVHWVTDIVGSVFLSSGLFMIYRYMADYFVSKKVTLKTEESDGVQ
jgi:undecaprenyl-diphosphatase